MKTKRKSISVPIAARLLNPDPKYYHQCTVETQRAIRNLSMVLLFTVTVCGAIFAASICKYCFDGNYFFFFPVFAATTLFYFLIDKP